MNVSIFGSKGYTYILKATENLIDWESVDQGPGAEETLILKGSFDLSKYPRRFFKVVKMRDPVPQN